MKNRLKITYLFVAILGLSLVSCEKEQKVDTEVRDQILTARETLTKSEAYYHDDIHETSGGSYVISLTLMSDGVDYDYAEKVYTGTGYAFELELNSEFLDSIAPGVYKADTLDVNGDHMYNIKTYNLENTFLTVVNGSSNLQQVLEGGTIKISLSGTTYTITVEMLTATGLTVKGSYTGTITLQDIFFYQEKVKNANPITFEAVSAAYTADAYNNSNAINYGATIHTIALTNAAGDVLTIEVYASDMDVFSLPSDTYSMNQGFYECYSYDNKTNSYYSAGEFYRTEKDAVIGSYLLTAAGEMYYLNGDDVTIETDGTVVKSVSLSTISLGSGTEITASYTKAN